MPCASFSMLDGPGGTGSDEVRVPVHGCWDRRDVSVVGVFYCVKECMGFVTNILNVQIDKKIIQYLTQQPH